MNKNNNRNTLTAILFTLTAILFTLITLTPNTAYAGDGWGQEIKELIWWVLSGLWTGIVRPALYWLLELIFGAAFAEDPGQVLARRYWPGWWLALFPLFWWRSMRPGGSQWTAVAIGALLLVGDFLVTAWSSLSTIGVIAAIALVGFGGSVVASIAGVLLWLPLFLWKWGNRAYQGKALIDKISKKAPDPEQASKTAGGVDLEAPWAFGDYLRMGLASIALLVTFCTLFGGPGVVRNAKEGIEWGSTLWQLSCLGLGLVLTARGGFWAWWDAHHSSWVCLNCGGRVWDIGLNKPKCPHCECPSPQVPWTCGHKADKDAATCGTENDGSAWACVECDTARPQAKKFAAAAQASASFGVCPSCGRQALNPRATRECSVCKTPLPLPPN
ncbi:magnesium transporter [Candidatus Peregrinibacteria bacterium]|nr:MAG: magnesium transporter [Candidatus Peregrinibacteria bacterium]